MTGLLITVFAVAVIGIIAFLMVSLNEDGCCEGGCNCDRDEVVTTTTTVTVAEEIEEEDVCCGGGCSCDESLYPNVVNTTTNEWEEADGSYVVRTTVETILAGGTVETAVTTSTTEPEPGFLYETCVPPAFIYEHPVAYDAPVVCETLISEAPSVSYETAYEAPVYETPPYESSSYESTDTGYDSGSSDWSDDGGSW